MGRGRQPVAGADEWAFYLIKLGVNWLFSIIFGPDWLFNTKRIVGMCLCTRVRRRVRVHMDWAFLFSRPCQEEIGLY